MANAIYPFATLKVNKEQLDLNASIVGNLIFPPSDIVFIIQIIPFTKPKDKPRTKYNYDNIFYFSTQVPEN